jgi:histidinol-phosphate/aromatic aminotransferase/cobyric acid decarboxylase-like protein
MRQVSALRFHGDVLAAADAVDFAVNVWPGPVPAGLRAAMIEALDGGRYPDEWPAKAAIGRRHSRPAEEVLLANGSCDVFWLLAALAPRHAVCIHPSFTEPEAALRVAGVPVTRVLRRPPTWELDPAAVPADADLVVLGNPNNPTGNLDPAEAVASLAAPGRVLVVDEAFIDFVPAERESLAARRDLPGLVVVRSLTKLWALPGVRAGYALASADLVVHLAESRQPWSVNAAACAALEWCAGNRGASERVARQLAQARDELVRGLRVLGLEPFPSVANFLLLELPAGGVESLAERGIAVRPAASFPGLDKRHVRIAVRPPADNAKLLDALAEVLDG